MENKIIVEEKYATLRIDKLFTLFNENYSRAYFSNLIKNGNVTVNKKNISPSYKVKSGDVIDILMTEKESNLPLKQIGRAHV